MEEFPVTNEKMIPELIRYTLDLMANPINKPGKVESEEMINIDPDTSMRRFVSNGEIAGRLFSAHKLADSVTAIVMTAVAAL